MKMETVWYVERCLTCRMVKAKHQRPYRMLQPLEVSLWKWEQITMNFITKSSKTVNDFDAFD